MAQGRGLDVVAAVADPGGLSATLTSGGMAERTNARLLKSLGPQGPGVRIPLPPLIRVGVP